MIILLRFAEETTIVVVSLGGETISSAVALENITGVAIGSAGAVVPEVGAGAYYYSDEISDFIGSYYDYFWPTTPVASIEEERAASPSGRVIPQAYADLSQDTDENRRREDLCELAKKFENKIFGTIRGTVSICYGLTRNNREDRSWEYEVWLGSGADYAPSKISARGDRQAAYVLIGESAVEIDAYRRSDKAAIDAKCHVEKNNMFDGYKKKPAVLYKNTKDELIRQAKAVAVSPEVDKLVWIFSTPGARSDFESWFSSESELQRDLEVEGVIFTTEVKVPPAEGELARCISKR